MTNIRIYKHLYFVVNLGDGVIATSYKTVTLLDIQYDQSVRLVTVGENIIATIKMREKNFNRDSPFSYRSYLFASVFV